VQKVIQLLKSMQEKGTAEMKDEEVQFTKFKQFCEFTLNEKKVAITQATSNLDMLSADIEKAGAEAETLTDELAAHQASLDKASSEQAQATKVREEERAAFELTLKDYSASISAVDRALKVLREKAANKKQASSLLQLSATSSPADTARALESFLMEDAAPEAYGYEFQSGGVITLLEDLQNRFSTERIDLEKAEASKRQAYAMLVQSLEAQQKTSKKDISQKTEYKAKRLEDKAAAESSRQATTSSRDADQKYADDLKATCDQKADEMKDRTRLRKEELAAIQKAVDIISGGAVAGTAAKYGPGLIQTASGSVYAVLRSKVIAPQIEVARFLQKQARHIHSEALSALAVRIGEEQPGNSGLQKVQNLIESMIVKLNEDAQADASKKNYCDKEMKSNEATRTEKADAVTSLQADIDKKTADIAQLTEQIALASKEITELNVAMNNATELRQKEKNKNEATIKEAKQAQAAVAQAVTVLNEFYAKAGQATAFVQTATLHKQPAIFNKPYTGMSGANGGVIGLLEVIESDFARLQAETTAAEEAAVKEFETFMEDSKVDKVKKSKDVQFKTAKKSEKAQEASILKGSLQATQKELDAALAYFDKLKPDCVDPTSSFEERKARREEEIKNLQDAVSMLTTLSG
jgi:hypothetical protein